MNKCSPFYKVFKYVTNLNYSYTIYSSTVAQKSKKTKLVIHVGENGTLDHRLTHMCGS